MAYRPRVVSLFSGAGGMDLGFIRSGYEVVWANDFFKEAVDTYKRNIGDHIVFGDITEIPSETIPDGIDVVIGGFPCQGFSVSNNKRSIEDSRNFLYKEMLRVIKDKQPKYFVAENVKGLLSLEGGKVIDMIINDFTELGYKVDYKVLNAAEYGVPQARERVIILGNRLGLSNTFPEPTHYIGKDPVEIELMSAITVKEAIGHLKEVPVTYDSIKLPSGKYIHNHIASTSVSDKFYTRKYAISQEEVCDYLKQWRSKAVLSAAKVDKLLGYKHTAGHWFRKDKYGSIPTPEDWWKLKDLLKFDDKYDKQVTTLVEKEITFEQSLRITNWDRPSATITATGPEIHINKKRRLSVRECAILQTFPDNHIFEGSMTRMYTQVGNAVPVLLAEHIARALKETIEGV